jgi:hypothetical protein
MSESGHAEAKVSGSQYYIRQWPKIEGYKQELHVDHDKARKYIDALDQDRKDLIVGKGHNGKGYPDDLDTVAKQIQPQDVGAGGDGKKTSYPAGEVLWQSIQNVNTQFPKAYRAWLQSYKQVVEALYSAAGIYKQSEVDSTPTSGTTTDPTNNPTTKNQPSATNGANQT